MTNFNPLPPLEELQNLLELAPDSPTWLKWRNSGKGIKRNRIAGWWEENEWGKIRINNRYYKTHRIVWALHNRRDPGDMIIDHINRKPHDNNPNNLRIVGRSENRYNSRMDGNSTGYRGVAKLRGCERWVARVRKDGASHYLGCFDSAENAYAAYLKACLGMYGYLPSQD